MKTVYLIIIIVLYIFGTLIGYTQKISGDQSKVSMREAKYPILTSLNPLGQPLYTYSYGYLSGYLRVIKNTEN